MLPLYARLRAARHAQDERRVVSDAYKAWMKHDYSHAIRSFEELLALLPNAAFARDYSKLLLEVGRPTDAVRVIESAGIPISSRLIRSLKKGNSAFLQGHLICEPEWYCSHNRVPSLSGPPFDHYVRYGFKSHFRPSRYFSDRWYCIRYPDVASANDNPLVHYLLHGAKERRDPFELFSSDWYLSEYLEIAGAGWNPLAHYICIGRFQGKQPNRLFDGNWYLGRYPDVATADVDPLMHFWEFGCREQRQPSPYFDTAFYYREYPDVSNSHINALEHYLHHGWKEGRRPNPYFDPMYYAQNYLSSNVSVDPLYHYISQGYLIGNRPNSDFDPEFYFKENPDCELGTDPLLHYLKRGAERGSRTNPLQAIRRFDAVIAWSQLNQVNERRIDALEEQLGFVADKLGEVTSEYIKKIWSADAVSFDIFDTLLQRTTGKPWTVFALTEIEARSRGLFLKDFVNHRIEAETAARTNVREQEVTFDDIYAQLQERLQLPHDAVKTIKSIELDIEQSVCKARIFGKELLGLAAELGKKIYLVTDSYLDASFIARLLTNARISGYDELFVSSHYGATKHFGHMFDLVANKASLTTENLIHVGDNEHSDRAIPSARGIATIIVPRNEAAIENPVLRSWATLTPCRTHAWKSIAAGVAASQIADDRSSDLTRDEVQLRRFGYEALMPALAGFAQYVARIAHHRRVRCLYFVARDGFYLKEAYDCLRQFRPELPETKYLLCSRRVARLAELECIEDVERVLEIDHFPMTVADLLRTRTGLSKSEIAWVARQELWIANFLNQEISTGGKLSNDLKRIVETYSKFILAKAKRLRAAYRQYLLSVGFDKVGDCIVDIGYRGTIQRRLSHIADRPIYGIYFSVWPEITNILTEGMKFSAYNYMEKSVSEPIVRYAQLFELLFSATHGSLFDFADDQEDSIVLAEPSLPGSALYALEVVRSAALRSAQMLFETTRNMTSMELPTGAESIAPLVHALNQPSDVLVSHLADVKFEDDFGGDRRSLVRSTKLNSACWVEGERQFMAASSRNTKSITRLDRFEGTSTIPSFLAK